jgi:hypothetical protein
MGGFGSGRHRGRKKRTVEGCSAIDTTDLRRWGLLVPGTRRSGELNWTRGGGTEPHSRVSYALALGDVDGTLRLSYAVVGTNERFDYSVRLATTLCHFGGLRWWFVCPLVVDGVPCGRRIRKVYLSGRYFGCRHCHDLTYTSTQQSDKRVYAALRGGLGLTGAGDLRGRSVAELGLLLKVYTHRQRRLDKLLDRAGD